MWYIAEETVARESSKRFISRAARREVVVAIDVKRVLPAQLLLQQAGLLKP